MAHTAMSLSKKAAANSIKSYTFEEFVAQVKSFHGFEAIGVIIGGFMVDMAYKHLPAGGLFDAICETPKCLPDAIQLLTPCTIGNGWLTIVDTGRYALAMYEKTTGNGVRISLDHKKLGPFPEIRSWFLKLKTKAEQDERQLMEEVRVAGSLILTASPIKVDTDRFRSRKKQGVVICPSCGEAYPLEHGLICFCCLGRNPYLP